MEILTLDSSTFYPDQIVENYSSMIWTERYVDAGEFELKTQDVDRTMALLPEDTLITLRDTKEVMYVETLSIENDDTNVPELTVTGRSFPSFLENRDFVSGNYGEKSEMAIDYTAAEQVSVLMFEAFVNGQGLSPGQGLVVTQWRAVNKDITEAIPNVSVSDSTTVTGTRASRFLETGDVYSQILTRLTEDNLGIRSIRPDTALANIVTVAPGVAQNAGPIVVGYPIPPATGRGVITKTSRSSVTNLLLDVYNGVDRTSGQNSVEPVIFHKDTGDLVTPTYLLSKNGYKTMARVTSSVTTPVIVYRSPGDAALSGFAKRIIDVDAGSPETDETRGHFINSLPAVGADALRAANKTSAIDATVSSNSKYKYNRDYFLGDRLTLIGSYGIKQTMIVTEYTRTDDTAGSRDTGYPGLMVPS